MAALDRQRVYVEKRRAKNIRKLEACGQNPKVHK